MNSLAICIVVWNNAQDAIECADSLLKQSFVKDLKVVFVDNNSDSKTLSILTSYAETKNNKQIELVQTGRNSGTAGGFNAGVAWALDHSYEFVGSLNADAVADEKWAASLVNELTTNINAGIATGLLLRRDGKTIDTSGDFYTIWGLPGPRLRDAPREKAPTSAEYVFGSSGGGFIARTTMFNDIGLFDEKYFMYYEDVDLSFRAQLMGYKVRFTPDAIAYHKLGASSKTVPGLAIYNTFKNLPMLFSKNVPLRLWPSIYPRFLLLYLLILVNAIKKGSGKYALKGFFMSWIYIPHMFHERFKIQRSRRVSTEYISSIILHDLPIEQTGMRKFRKIFTGK